MYYELSKSQKKIAHIVMDKGLDNHYKKALTDAESIIDMWHEGKLESLRDAYMKLWASINKNDSKIARIYNDKGGSRWVEIMALQLRDGAITIDDLRDFDEEVRDIIIGWSR